MIDLRKEFDSFLRKYGYNVYLQRRLPAGTYDTQLNYSNQLEIHTVRSRPPGAGMADEEPEGITHSNMRIFYFRWDANPSEGDRIYELAENKTFIIADAEPKRGFKGRFEYWQVQANRESPN